MRWFKRSQFQENERFKKGKWCCVNGKDFTSDTIPVVNQAKDCSHSDKILSDLKDSVNFMSGKFEDFKTQLSDIIKSIYDVRSENKQLKEQNLKLANEMSVANKKNLFYRTKNI